MSIVKLSFVSIFFPVTEIYSDIRTAFDGAEEEDGPG
jgi:hypothetical protein